MMALPPVFAWSRRWLEDIESTAGEVVVAAGFVVGGGDHDRVAFHGVGLPIGGALGVGPPADEKALNDPANPVELVPLP